MQKTLQVIVNLPCLGYNTGTRLLLLFLLSKFQNSPESLSTSNRMFGRATWDKLPEFIFGNFGIAQVKRGQFKTLKIQEGNLSQKLPKTNMSLC